MNGYLTGAALLGALALTGSSLANAQSPAAAPPPSPRPAPACFYSSDWNSWTAPNAHTLYIRVGVRRIYRLDFDYACTSMTEPNARLITHVHGSNSICSPIDIDLKVSNGDGFAEPCIVSKMTQLSDVEAAALPKDQRP